MMMITRAKITHSITKTSGMPVVCQVFSGSYFVPEMVVCGRMFGCIDPRCIIFEDVRVTLISQSAALSPLHLRSVGAETRARPQPFRYTHLVIEPQGTLLRGVVFYPHGFLF